MNAINLLSGIVFANNEMLPRRAIFLHPQPYQHSYLATTLGCKLGNDDFIEVNEMKQTSTSGVYAVSNVSSPYSQIAFGEWDDRC